MPQAQVTPQYVNAAKPGKQYGNIKEASGAKWIIPAGWDRLFSPNVPAHIDYETKTWGNESVNIVRGVNGAMQPAPAPLATPVPLPASPVEAAPAAVPVNLFAKGPIIDGHYTDQQRAEDIFVTGIVGRVLGGSSGNFGIMDIDRIAKAAVQAWAGRHQVALPDGYTEANPPPPGPGDAR